MAFDIRRHQKSARRIERFLRKNPKKATPDDIHDLRTSIRRVETTFEALGLHSSKNVGRLLENLRKVRKRAGKVRDMDVRTADALTLQTTEEQECLTRFLRHLGAKRKEYAEKLHDRIAQISPKLLRDLRRASKQAAHILENAATDPHASEALRCMLERTSRLSSELKFSGRLTRGNLHSYRLKIKELLNILQLSQGTEDLQLRERLSEVKDAIGEWHDWEELIAMAAKLLDHRPTCRLIKGMTEVSSSKYVRALLLVKQLRVDPSLREKIGA